MSSGTWAPPKAQDEMAWKADAAAGRTAVWIRVEHFISRDGTRTAERTVFCPRERHTVSVACCEACPFRTSPAIETEDRAMECAVEVGAARGEHLDRAPVGALVRGSIVSVDGALAFAALRVTRIDGPLVLVSGGLSGPYLGCIVAAVVDAAIDLPPRVRAMLLDTACAADLARRSPPPVVEDAPILEAAAAMARAHARHLPLVTAGGRVAGVVSDLDLLRAMAPSPM